MHIFFTLLYLGTVALSVAVAYDPTLAWKPGGVLAAGALLAPAMAAAGRRREFFSATGVSCALLAAAVGGYFLLRYDWDTAGEGKFAMIRQAGLWVQSHRPALPLAEDINGNVAGGALALLLPPGAVAVARAWRSRTPRSMARALFLTPALAGAAAALILTSSRGAWAGISVGGLVAEAMAVTARRAPGRYWVVTLSVAALVLLAALGLTVAVVAWPAADRLLGGVAGADNSVLSRAQLWRDGLALIGDYPFTGSGAGSTMMVYSTYAMLLHVGYISHAHNLFLQMALEQGVPGLAAFLALWALAWAGLAKRSNGEEDGWRAATAAALTALVVHGTVDAGLYTAYLAPVLFVPVGLGLGFLGR
ncbi:MAG: O-antigen ligase family protein, partial [Anaerolineae bacterium]